MGLFHKKDPAEEYQEHKKAYTAKISVAKNKNVPPLLQIRKCSQAGQTAQIYVHVYEGCLKINDILEIGYVFGNRLGISKASGRVTGIYQVHGTGKNEKRISVTEAYEHDLVWIDVPGIDVNLMDKQGFIRRSQAKNVPIENSGNDTITVSYDAEVSKMVNYFKDELSGYFASDQAIGHITQDLSHSLLLQKKRLDRLGITMRSEKSSETGAASVKMAVNRYSSSQYDVAEAHEPIKLLRKYTAAGQEIYRDNDWRICSYLLAGAKLHNEGSVSCPSCGNVAEREELLNGCPYCGTQFTIQDLSLRVAGYCQKRAEQSKLDRFQGKIRVDDALYHEAEQKEYDKILAFRMKDIDPLFSAAAFYNSMRNKLYSVVFAESIPALQNLADRDFDVAPYFGRFEDVIDIDIQTIETKNITKNTQYVLVDAVMTAMVLHYNARERSAKWTKEIITLSVVKDIKNKTKNIFEPSKIQCASCGGSYSLYEGKACSYCGREIDYLMYDWLLVDLDVIVCD